MIPAIPSIPAVPSVGSSVEAGASQAGAGAGAADGASSSPFSNFLGSALDSLNGSEQTATNLSLQAATGNASIADVTVASSEADLETQLVTAVRDKAVTAFNTIMGMQA
ncbi:MAG: flagellar hook-basal body complex protein FliE [Acidimicrobiales bacterium]|jgi:flagellar hook-basal body complex protein FliE